MKNNLRLIPLLQKISLFIALFIYGSNLNANCPPYNIPEVKEASDFSNIVYIDPSGSHGNGTINSPYNSINKIGSGYTIPGNTAYLIKRGTTLNERIRKTFINSYIGAYGEGDKPIVFGGIRLVEDSYDVTLDDLNIRSKSNESGGNDAIIFGEDINVKNITVANSYITGVYDGGKTFKYPYRAIKGKNHNWTIFNNIISHVYDDGIGMGSGDNLTIVRNYIHSVDLKRVGNQYTDKQAGELTDGSEFNYNCGDAIHLRTHANLYIAGNYVDRSATSWKFALILKMPWDDAKEGVTVEYNTFIGNNGGPGGGAVVYLEGPKKSRFTKNVFDATKKGTLTGPTTFYDVSGGGSIATQSLPYGVFDNHFIRANSDKKFYSPTTVETEIDKSNGLFTGYSAYANYKSNNTNIGLYGSDIDPDNFWEPLCETEQGYNIKFDVTDKDGTAIDNATITFAGTTNPQGNYTFEEIAAGTYSYSIVASGFQNISASGVNVSQNMQIPVQMTVVPPTTYSINFTITDNNDAAINNATVTFAGKTNAPGNYSFSEITAGTYSYSVVAEGFENAGASNLSISQDTQLAVKMTPVAPSTYSVNFNITDDNDAALNNAIVTFAGKTNTPGNYSFSGITTGTYSYSVVAEGYQNVNANNINISQNTQLSVKMTSTAPTTYSVSFNITDNNGTAIKNAMVTFAGTTNPEGNYSFSGIQSGTYEYVVMADGFQNVIEDGVDIQQNTLIPVQMSLVSANMYEVTFDLRDATGSAIPNAVVTFAGVTNPQGIYTFNNIGEGTYTYSITAEGYENISASDIQVSENEFLQIVMQEVLPVEHTVTFIIFDALNDDIIIEDATITLNNVTNQKGDYSFESIAQGSYVFKVEAPGYETIEDQINDLMMDITVPVYMDKNSDRVRINAKSDPPGSAFISGAGEYPVSEEVKMEAAPMENDYKFVGWTENGVIVSTDPVYQFVAAENRIITASFEYSPRSFDVFVALADWQSGEILGTGSYTKGETAAIEFITGSDYNFKGWANSNGQIVSRQNPYYIEVERDVNLVAVVEKVELLDQEELTVYPNPSDGRLFVNHSWEDSVNLNVHNAQGTLVQTRTVLSSNSEIDLTELPPGLYMLHFEYQNEVIVKKVLFN